MDHAVYIHTLGFKKANLQLFIVFNTWFTTLNQELTLKKAVFTYAFLTWQDLEDRARMMTQRMKMMQEMRGSGIGSEYRAIGTDSVDA